jgi:hypothetical protein
VLASAPLGLHGPVEYQGKQSKGTSMRNLGWMSLVSVLALFAAGCATGPTIRVDKDPSTDLTQYKTFGFFDQVATDRAQYSTILTERLKQATRIQMERVGYTETKQDPDLRVNFYVNVVQKQEIRSTPSATVGMGYYGYRGGMYGAWGGYPYDVDTVDYREGTLSIDLVDARKNQLVWQGVAEGRVSDEVRQNPGPAIDAVIAEIFRNFPNPPSN